MAAPINHVAQKSDRIWRHALLRAVKRRHDGKGSPQQLERIADACVKQALDGDMPAIREIGDRLDGKPAQAVTVDMAVAITRIERRIIDPVELIAETVVVKALEHDDDSDD